MIAQIKEVLVTVLTAPFLYPNMLWILLPVIIAIILMELYFKRYPREGIGHHRSLENTMFLVFLIFHLAWYLETTAGSLINYIVLSLSSMLWIWIAFLDFFHRIPTKLYVRTSAKLWIFISAYFTMVIIYADLLDPLNPASAISLLVVMCIICLSILFVHKLMIMFEPKAYEEIEEFLEKIEKDIEKAHKKNQPR